MKNLILMILPFALLFTNAIASSSPEMPEILKDLENDDVINTEEIEDEFVKVQGQMDSAIVQGQGCFCAAQFTAFAQTAADLIKTPLAAQVKSLKKLKKSIKNHNTTLEERTAQLDKKINLLKEETLRNKEILFLLRQKNNLQENIAR